MRHLEVYLVRHGQTEFNVQARLQGWADSPLTPLGYAEAAKLGRVLAKRLPAPVFDAAFCSTLSRTVATAEAVLSHAGLSDLSIMPLDDLREYGFGEFEGQPAAVLYQYLADKLGILDIDKLLYQYRHGNSNLFAEILSEIQDDSETEADFSERLWRGMAKVAESSPKDGRVLVVSHGMAIVALLKSLDDSCILYKSPPNVSVSRLMFDGRAWHLMAVAEVWNEMM